MLAKRNTSTISRRKNPLSEKQIWNRAMVTGAIGGAVGYVLAHSSLPTTSSGPTFRPSNEILGLIAGFVTGMSVGALAFGAKPRQLPRIVFGFPRR